MLDRADQRHKDGVWNCGVNGEMSFAGAQLAVLMDIRDELKELNGLLRCPNFVAIPRLLRGIRLNTGQRKRVGKRR